VRVSERMSTTRTPLLYPACGGRPAGSGLRAETILAGGRVYALGRLGLRPRTHLALGGGVVLAVGGEEVMGLRGPGTRVVGLGGAAVLPGFNDAHAHVVYYGLTSFGADLTGSRSIGELQARLRRVAERLEPGEWCQGRGYSVQELAEGRPPHRLEVDAAVGERPCYVDERGGHSRVASTAALRLAGIGPGTPDPPGGSVGRDPGGVPDGRLVEAAMRLVADRQPPPPLSRRRTGILRCQRLLLSRGVTSVGAAVNRGFADDLRAFQQLAEEGRLRVRVNEFLSWELLEAASGLGVRAGFGGSLVRAGPVKVFVDGGVAAGAVALRGRPVDWRTPPAELRVLVSRASRAGLQVAAHAIGDAAIEAMCDAVEAAGPDGLRHRVEHCTACPPDLQRRLASLGMAAVMQPLFAAHGRERAAAVFGPRLEPHLAAHAALLAAGVRLAFSSDLPVAADPSPWPGLAAAGLPPAAALRAYTEGGAWTSFEERAKGTLEPGMLADLQVYDGDPVAAGPETWRSAPRPRLVMLGGQVVHRARGQGGL
jgi:predicted amidohydrolase YtcJ